MASAATDVEEEDGADETILIPFTKRRLGVFRKWLVRNAELLGEFDDGEMQGMPECVGVMIAYMSHDWKKVWGRGDGAIEGAKERVRKTFERELERCKERPRVYEKKMAMLVEEYNAKWGTEYKVETLPSSGGLDHNLVSLLVEIGALRKKVEDRRAAVPIWERAIKEVEMV